MLIAFLKFRPGFKPHGGNERAEMKKSENLPHLSTTTRQQSSNFLKGLNRLPHYNSDHQFGASHGAC
jgi:hypothetical protein